MSRPTLSVIVTFFLLQLLTVALQINGPFLDEGIYATAGVRLLTGYGDNYDWFGGSAYVFPVLSGAAYLLGGLAGSRILTAILYGLALVAFSKFVQRSFGIAASFWATLLLSINGVFFSHAHLAVYDAAAFLGLCGSLWSAIELARAPRLRWVVQGALFAALTVTSKYYVVVILAPVLAISLLSSRRRPWQRILLTAAASIVVTATYLWLAHGFVVPRAAFASLGGYDPLFSRDQLIFQVVYVLLVPLSLSVWGFLRVAQQRAQLAIALLLAALLWPALQVLRGTHVSLIKHAAYGFVFLYPLAGISLSHLWKRSRLASGLLLSVLASCGATQAYWNDLAWPDIRPAVRHILPMLREDDRVAVEWGWSFGMYAVLGGHLRSPLSITDRYMYEQGANLCEHSWIIGSVTRPNDPSDPFFREAVRCGFALVKSFPVTLHYVFWPGVLKKTQWYVLAFRRPPSEGVKLGPIEP